MPVKQEELLTAGALAKALGVPDGKVKKAIQELSIAPKAKKGVCNLYGAEVLPKIRAKLAK